MRFVDLFGGIGGFRRGIERATQSMGRVQQKNKEGSRSWSNQNQRGRLHDWECVGYYDSDKFAVQTYNKNFGENHEPTDITTVPAETVPDHDLLCAGFPCQSFSIAGKRKGFKDTRGTLFFDIIRIATAKRTPYLFLENVKGLLSHDQGRTFSTILSSLDELGYDCQWQVLNSKHYGVPQNRERVFIIASLREKPRPKIFPLQKDAAKVQGVPRKEVVGSITTAINRGHSDTEMEMSYRIHMTGEIRKHEGSSTLKQSMGTGGNNVPMVAATIRAEHHNTADVHYISDMPMDVANCVTDGYLMTGERKRVDGKAVLTSAHERRLHRLTPTECCRLQGFPDDWTKGVSDTQQYRQLGNAVTVNVIQAIVEEWIK